MKNIKATLESHFGKRESYQSNTSERDDFDFHLRPPVFYEACITRKLLRVVSLTFMQLFYCVRELLTETFGELR